MQRSFSRLLIASLVVCVVGFCAYATAVEKAKSLFDGKSLSGWEGNEKFWSVKDGAITGQTTADNPASGNTFLLWKGGELGDFELTLKFRIVGGNSGIQFRSQDLGNHVVGGYQGDFDADGAWTGTLYDERGRGVLAKRGSKVEVTESGEKKGLGTTTAEKEILSSIKKEGWNDYKITAKGNHITLTVNGNVTVDIVDKQSDQAEEKGILALQLHAGPPMMVQFKDIELTELK